MGIFNRRRSRRTRDEPRAGSLMPRFARSADWRANSSEAICSAAARMARTLASAPLHLYKAEEIQHKDPLERLVRYSPAPGWNGHTFVLDMEFTRNAVGRAYALITRDDLQTATSMHYIDPARVETLRAQETGDVWHRVLLDDGKTGYIPDADMLNLWFLGTTGAVTPTSILKGSLDYDSQIKEFSLKALDGVHDVILLNVPGANMSREKRVDLVNDILAGYKASGKAALVLDSGVTATRLSASPVDPKVLDVEKVTKNRVSGVYGMSAHLLGDGESTRASSEEEIQAFLTLTMVPAMAQWEAELDRKLLYWEKFSEGYHFGFETDALSRANTGVLAEKYMKAIRGGWMTPNEVRKREKLPPDTNGGKLLLSRDLVPLEIPVQSPELLLQGGRGKTNGSGMDA